ncbi:hypothetical protein QAD02_013458 [Eretmocerus hayati]|uniref:Uncharacterized protein n=1 Tax=Eretmocerus hayati TaxID=131215 RepID=A0ACC2P3N2_9HYME|nr:hypothetical protein QAD02_013458 [Eretmocerus hayati]
MSEEVMTSLLLNKERIQNVIQQSSGHQLPSESGFPLSPPPANCQDDTIIEYPQKKNASGCQRPTTDDSTFTNRSDGSSDEESDRVFSAQMSDFNYHSNMTLTDRLREWALRDVSSSKVDELLRILTNYHEELPMCSKTVLKSNLNLHEGIRDFDPSNSSDEAKFVYFGILRSLIKLIKLIDPSLHPDKIILPAFNVDGVSLFNSSSFIVVRPNLHRPIFTWMNPWRESFICDRPARSFVKCTENHGAFHACERCLVEGSIYKDRRVYPVRGEPRRTLDPFRRLNDIEHHNDISPFLNVQPSINSLKLFVLDLMHLGCLGIMEALLITWLSGESQLTQEKKMRISLTLVELSSQI